MQLSATFYQRRSCQIWYFLLAPVWRYWVKLRWWYLSNFIAIFLIYGQFWATQKPDSGRIVCKTYVFINSSLLSNKNWKHDWIISNTALKVLFWLLTLIFLQRNADVIKIKRVFILKDIFPKNTYGSVLTYQISNF